MAMQAARGVVLNFVWQGPSVSDEGVAVKVVDLTFTDAATEISVDIPAAVRGFGGRKLLFTCQRYSEEERRVERVLETTTQESLVLTVEQIRSLKVTAKTTEESPEDSSIHKKCALRAHEIELEIPKGLASGRIYNLVISSKEGPFSFSACVEKSNESEEKASLNERSGRMCKMGEELIAEGVRNLELAKRGGGSFSGPADVFAHGMQGVVRAGQQMHPGIQVPNSKPSETPLNLDKLTVAELQSRFEKTFIKDKQFEYQRMQAARRGDVAEVNRIISAEHANSQLLINLAQTLEKKGASPQIPQTEEFQAAERQAAEAQANAVKESCKTQ